MGAAQPSPPSATLIRRVNVVDVATGSVLHDQDVLIVDDRIIAVGFHLDAAAGRASLIIEGRGKFLIPALWDCHIHLSWTTPSALPLLTALGITEVRDLGGKFTELERWRAQIADGTLVGPHIMRVGPILNGKSFNPYQFVPGSSDATRADVRLLKYLGVDEIKVHRRLPRDWYLAAIDESKRQNIRLVGHIPMEVSPEEASNAGQYMIEHTETLFEGTFSAKLTDAELPKPSIPGSTPTSRTSYSQRSFVMAHGLIPRSPVTSKQRIFRILRSLSMRATGTSLLPSAGYGPSN